MTENVDPETASDHLAYFERLFVDYVTERLLDLLHLLLVSHQGVQERVDTIHFMHQHQMLLRHHHCSIHNIKNI
jgi:hypothetical protein